MDTVGGFVLADGRRAKALTGVDDHSRFCVSAQLMLRESSQRVCEGLALAMRTYGVPGADPDRQRQGLHRPVQPATGRGALRPGLSGERHRAPADPAAVTDHDREDRAVPPGDPHRVPHRPGLQEPRRPPRPSSTNGSHDYNTNRPHQALDMATPAARFLQPEPARCTALRRPASTTAAPTSAGPTGPGWPDEPARSAWCA